ncbi:MAG TPA: hypothetical protein VN448_04340 [Gammaproteobacteria bacterium]|jgi:hypothetical protein|nr:hypothetical protein [Gammaproteobacteria bacterium]
MSVKRDLVSDGLVRVSGIVEATISKRTPLAAITLIAFSDID